MGRVQLVAETFRVAQQATLEKTHALVVKTAKARHAEVMRAEPRPRTFTRFVDGQKGAREEAVRPNGLIVYTYPRLEQVARFAMEQLFSFSPVRSGRYRSAHTLFLNGRAVENLNGWREGDEVSISNPLPYSRKIELGAMTMHVSGTDQVYLRALRKVRARYGNLAEVLFTYRGIVGGAVAAGRAGTRAENRYPTLLIKARK